MKTTFCNLKDKEVTKDDCKSCKDKKMKNVFFKACENAESRFLCDSCNKQVSKEKKIEKEVKKK